MHYWGNSEEQTNLNQGNSEQHAPVPVSKVRPFNADMRKSQSDTHRYIMHANKAQAFHDVIMPELLAPTALRPVLKQHSMQRCDQFPTQGGPTQHDIELCQRCSPEVDIGQHNVSDCERYAVQMAPNAHDMSLCTKCILAQNVDAQSVDPHNVSKCPRYSIYQGPPTHPFDNCKKEPTEQDVEYHRASQCDKFSMPRSPVQHQLERCLRCSQEDESNFHTIADCKTYPVYAGPDHHVTQECTLYPNESPYLPHSLLNDAKHPLFTEVLEDEGCIERSTKEDIHPGGYPESEDESGEGGMRHTRPENRAKTFDSKMNAAPRSPTWFHDRSLSYASGLDYKRTIQWLRDVIRTPEPYTSRLTSFPRKNASGEACSRRISAPEGPTRSPWIISELSPHPSIPDSKVDKHHFMRAVSDLEKLFDEALNLATEVSEQPEKARMTPGG